MPMVPALQTLALFGLLRSISAVNVVFYGIGRPQIVTNLDLFRLCVLASAIYPLTVRWGIMGASIAVLLSQMVYTIVFGYLVVTITECGFKNFSRLIALPLVNAIIMVIFIFNLKSAFNTVGIGQFILLVVVGIAAYFGVTYLLDRFFNYGMCSLIKESLIALKES